MQDVYSTAQISTINFAATHGGITGPRNLSQTGKKELITWFDTEFWRTPLRNVESAAVKAPFQEIRISNRVALSWRFSFHKLFLRPCPGVLFLCLPFSPQCTYECLQCATHEDLWKTEYIQYDQLRSYWLHMHLLAVKRKACEENILPLREQIGLKDNCSFLNVLCALPE